MAFPQLAKRRDPLMDWLAALIRKVAKERLSKPRKLR